MTLWNKRLAEITYADIDAFCRAGVPEGAQVDYKVEIPGHIEKVVSAFANTRGGLILLGVSADKITNMPDGASPGMQAKAGISERLTQICRDRIYPSVLPELSPTIEYPEDPSRVFIVARINESISAPHSIANGTNIYLRTNDVGDKFELAHIDRIAYLLKRRQGPESKREALLNRSLERVLSRYKTPGVPYFWFHICPEFPRDALCSLDVCRNGVFDTGASRCPDGFMGLEKRQIGSVNDIFMSSCGRLGDLFSLRAYRSANIDRKLGGMHIAVRLLRFVESASQFYSREDVSHPGMLHIAVGAGEVTGSQMYCYQESELGIGFPDATYRSDYTTSVDEIVDNDVRFRLVYAICKELFHSFDIGEPLPRRHWS